jgi:RimJ/RimL family protein N-acetyltransferase
MLANFGASPIAPTRPWCMEHEHWPFFALTITTPRLVLRYPNDDDLFALAAVLADGIHDPDLMPFNEPWTRAESPELERNSLRHWWGLRAALSPDEWHLPMAVFDDGEPVGVQGIGSRHFAVTRTVETGSWLVQRAQGRGIGKEMRAAVLHLAFAELGTVEAYTGAYDDNPASLGVTRSLGYEANGTELRAREGQPARMLSYVMTRSRWESRRRTDITIEGLDPCLPFLGASVDRDASATLK